MKLSPYCYLFFLCFAFLSCTQRPKNDFIYISEDSFKQNDSAYFPILLNYMLSVHKINDSLVVGPSVEYDRPPSEYAISTQAVQQRMRLHFKLIRKMGFNSLRLVGLNPLKYLAAGDSSIAQLEYFNRDRSRELFNLEPYQNKLVNSLANVVQLASEEDLRLMILLPKPKKKVQENEIRLNFIKLILDKFRDEPTVFSYDFFNEPLYFDNSEYKEYENRHREKEDAVALTNSWQDLMDERAPNQLITVGLSEPIEAFEWDPSILNIDFVSFHTYHPLRVPNEIYWYANYAKKPWIISETSLPADNDSISYEAQAIFMREALQRTIDCGGAGFGWWQFQDVSWGPFEHDHTAIMDREGYTLVGGDSILGTVKLASEVLKDFDFTKKGNCDCHPNYYNMMGYKNYLIEGKLVHKESGEPIEGAVIRGWNRYWSVGQNTFSDKGGVFRLYSNDEVVNFEISGPGTKTAKFYKKLNYNSVNNIKPAELEDRLLEYHSIHYQKFIKPDQKQQSVFDFDPKYFSDYLVKAELETIELDEVDL